MPNFATSEQSTFCTRQPYYKNNFGVFLCVLVYRLFVLNFWWCIQRNIVNISQSPSQQCLVFNSCYFHDVGFSTVVCPRCAPGIGGHELWGGHNANLGGTLKKIFFVPPTSKPCRRLCTWCNLQLSIFYTNINSVDRFQSKQTIACLGQTYTEHISTKPLS